MKGRWDKEMYILKVLITFNLLSLCVQAGYDVYVLVLWIFIRMCVRLPLDMCTCAHVRVQHQLSILLYCLLPFFKVNLKLRTSELQGLSCVPSTVCSAINSFLCVFSGSQYTVSSLCNKHFADNYLPAPQKTLERKHSSRNFNKLLLIK